MHFFKGIKNIISVVNCSMGIALYAKRLRQTLKNQAQLLNQKLYGTTGNFHSFYTTSFWTKLLYNLRQQSLIIGSIFPWE